MKKFKRLGVITAVAALVLDQLSKWWMMEIFHIAERSPVPVLPGFNLVMVWNRGVSFGMFGGHSLSPLVFVAVAFVMITVLCFWLQKAQDKWLAGGIGLIIGGALGNVIDRLNFGAVADFFDFYVGSYHWPAFNIADAFIFIGVVVLCGHSILSPEEKK